METLEMQVREILINQRAEELFKDTYECQEYKSTIIDIVEKIYNSIIDEKGIAEMKQEYQKNNVPPHTKVCGLLQALVFWMLRN